MEKEIVQNYQLGQKVYYVRLSNDFKILKATVEGVVLRRKADETVSVCYSLRYTTQDGGGGNITIEDECICPTIESAGSLLAKYLEEIYDDNLKKLEENIENLRKEG